LTITQAILKIKTEPLLSEHGNSLRGYIANLFPRYDILHNHKKDGRLLYLYPRVQYRVIEGEGYIIGIEEGVSVIQEIAPLLKVITLKGANYRIIRKQFISEDARFGIVDSSINYSFIKPWLALNEQNYQEYMKSGSRSKREKVLDAVLKGNILSLSKSLGYVVDRQINLTSLNLKAAECFLKSTPMLGFLGTFSVNFEIPDYWGIGKSVSRGFGTIIRCR